MVRSAWAQNALWAGFEDVYPFPNDVVSLTLDDGPDVGTEAVANYLKSQKIVGTFFIIGNQPNRQVGAEFYPSTLAKMVAAGQRLANHTYTHGYGGQIGDPAILAEINQLQALIAPYSKNPWHFIRAPHNYPNIETYNSMPGISVQFVDIERNYDAADWAYAARGEEAQVAAHDMLQLILDRNNQGGIIQMHDANESAAGSTYALQYLQTLVPELKRRGVVFGPPVLEFSDRNLFTAYDGDFSNRDGFGARAADYDTFRLADMNADGKLDAVMRKSDGLFVAYGYANRLGFDDKRILNNKDFTDAKGWGNAAYSASIQYGDVNRDGRMDIVARSASGMMVALNNGNGFNAATNWSFKTNNVGDFANADGGGKWGNNEAWYGTVRLVDINHDGRADICARSSEGIWIAYSTGNGFAKKRLAFTQNFKDAVDDGWNWGTVDRATTIQFADVNGDGWADIAARGIWGIAVALNTRSAGHEFDNVQATWWTTDYSNAANWHLPEYYKSVHFADVNGDGMADAIGRGSQGLWVALSNGARFTETRLWASDFSDANGFNTANSRSALQYGDIDGDGRADAAGRGAEGVWVGLAP
jgi:peptidoglycan/xylan/chitin deacetylase (PgdA/CDA1 family)